MSIPNLQTLDALTHDYAAFQSRKSGLATALGGVMALLASLQMFYPVRHFSGSYWPVQEILVLLTPVLWLPLKEWTFRVLYRGLGPAKALPDVAQERAKWQWIFVIAMVLITFQTLALLGFVGDFARVLHQPEILKQIPVRMSSVWSTWMWVAALPWLYLLVAPWWIRGVEEARAYLVLVGQGVLRIAFDFNVPGADVSRETKQWIIRLFLLFQVGLLAWAIRTIRRGWREHREYLAILRSLPRES
jgi:hypothetical protein